MAAEPVSMPEVQVEQKALALPDEARAIVIRSDADYQAAARFLRDRCKAVLREVDATFDPIIRAAHLAHKEAVAQKAKVAAPIQEAEQIVKSAIGSYVREQERRQLEERRAAEERARQLAEREALDRAVRLEAQGRTEAAEALLEQPIRPTLAPAALAPKAAGISVPRVWRAEVVDFAALVAAVAADPTKLNLLQPNASALRALAVAFKDKLDLPGVRAVSEDSVRARA